MLLTLLCFRQAYVEFASQQAATAVKHKIDAFGDLQQFAKKHTVTYSNPNVNPFKSTPKDAPVRDGKGAVGHAQSGGYNNRNAPNSNFRGRTPGYTPNRGAMGGVNGGGYNNNRNFSGPQMGMMPGGFQQGMGNFQNNQMGGQFSGFNRGGMMGGMRGGPGGGRGGRGGMPGGMMGGMPMGGMPMGGMGGMPGMGGPMGMGQMGGGMPGKPLSYPAYAAFAPFLLHISCWKCC
jgi:hypothetical protein